MTTAMRLRMKRIRTERLASYESFEGSSVKIEADIAFVYLSEEGYAVKGARKERVDLGEYPISIRIIGEEGELETRLYFGLIQGKKRDSDPLAKLLGRKVRETDDQICRIQKVCLEDLAELAKHCAEEQLDIADAQQYFEDEIFPVTNHQYVIDEDKDRVLRKW